LLLALIDLLAVGIDGSQVSGGGVRTGVVSRRYDWRGGVFLASGDSGQRCQPYYGAKDVGAAFFLLNVEHMYLLVRRTPPETQVPKIRCGKAGMTLKPS